MMSRDLVKAADELGKEKGISRSILTEALREAVSAAAAKRIGKDMVENVAEVEIDLDRGEISIKIPKEVTETELTDVNRSDWDEITVEAAKEYKEDPELGDVVMVPVTLEDFGRQSALIAKQKLMEKVREAEKQAIMDEFNGKIGEIVSGTILKTERDCHVVNIGKTEAFIHKRDTIGGQKRESGRDGEGQKRESGEFFEKGKYVRALLTEIKTDKGWPRLTLSRTSPNFLIKLFEAEIPEVFEGLIKVMAAAREPGERAKVAVYSISSSIDPVGACIGVQGKRINTISSELRNEKIDVVEWSNDPIQFVCNAISPAQVVLARIFEDSKTFELVVPNDQLSLAIGKKGQNVKLASMLTDWRIDVVSETEYQEIRKANLQQQEQDLKTFQEIYNLENLELSADDIATLHTGQIDDIEALSTAAIAEVATLLNISEDKALDLITQAYEYLEEKLGEQEQEADVDGAEQEMPETVDGKEG